MQDFFLSVGKGVYAVIDTVASMIPSDYFIWIAAACAIVVLTIPLFVVKWH